MCDANSSGTMYASGHRQDVLPAPEWWACRWPERPPLDEAVFDLSCPGCLMALAATAATYGPTFPVDVRGDDVNDDLYQEVGDFPIWLARPAASLNPPSL